MKTILIVALSLCAFFTPAQGQDYRAALGIRVGSANGLSAQLIGDGGLGAEALLVYRREGFRVVGMGKWYLPLGYASDCFLHLGLGGHAGYTGLIGDAAPARLVYGVDVMAGVEYVFPHSPVAFSIDLKPFWELRGTRSFSGNNIGATLRFLLD